MNQPKIILGITGSVAATKSEDLSKLLKKWAEVRCIATKPALHFLSKDFQKECLHDQEEWDLWQKKGDPVQHIDLRKWADVILIAPLTANTLAKIANGLCDNLLLSTLRAWDFGKKAYLAPAMNTYMWQHPLTRQQIETCENWGFDIIPPIEKLLACGDEGMGAMEEIHEINLRVKNLFGV